MFITLDNSKQVPYRYTGIVQRLDSKEWWFKGKWHRADSPACEWTDGTKGWYKEGKCHRADGPACEWADGKKEWWLFSKKITMKNSIILVL